MNSKAPQLTDDAREVAAYWCLQLSEGPLSAADQQSFQAWLGGDPDHADLFERTVIAWSALEDQASQPEMLRMRGASLESVHRLGRRRWQAAPMLGWRRMAAIAACFFVLVASGVWWRYAPSTFETGHGERRVVALADGSSLSMDADTRVDVRYLSDRRELWLDKGRAKFSVAKDALRPFSVRSGNRLIVATGTQFSVEKLANDVRVVLYEGHVELLDASTSKRRPLSVIASPLSAEQALVPGRQFIVPDAATTGRISPIDPGRSLGWESGLLEFTDEPLAGAVERLNRYGTCAQVAPSAASIIISGQFEGNKCDAFIEGVTSVFPIRASRNPDGSLVLSAKYQRTPEPITVR